MTDAAIQITQSAVEQFTEQYLGSLGSTIEKHGDRWEVTVPESVPTGVPSGQLTLFCDDVSADLGNSERQLHPESPFFQEIIAEASERQPTGKITIGTEDTQIELPRWLRESNITVNDATFTPYYDRSAVAILYRISIETVSEYQSELLRVTAVDIRSKERLPNLEKTFLESTLPAKSHTESQSIDFAASKMDELITHTREQIVDRVQPRVEAIHQEASRAADAEIEEYRQMQQQRIEQLEEKKTRLSDRINELSDLIQQSSDENDRIEALQKRKDLNSEYEDVDSKLGKLSHRRDKGFPEKQREIRERHALEVVVSPLSVTQIEYERGEIEIELSEEAITQSLTLGYGDGVGITEKLSCDVCGRSINAQNPLGTIRQGAQCVQCLSE